MTNALWTLPATRLSELLSRREVSSRELVQAHLDRIASTDERIHAFTTVFRERAMRDAERADEARARGDAKGPLHGLPVTVKECYEMEGLAATIGVPSRKDAISASDAGVVTLLREAGAVILGRTNLSQTMLFPESSNPIFGQTANPHSLAHSPGGSSGGEGAAIAAGMSPLGVGTDIGGSIRVPCSFCGITGIKPTLDRIPARGHKSVVMGQEAVRSQGGPMARTVGDLAMFFAAMDPARMTQLDGRTPPLPWTDPATVKLEKLRVGYYTDDGMLAPSRAIVRAIDRAKLALGARGCELVPFAPPDLVAMMPNYGGALTADGAEVITEALRGGEVDPVLRSLRSMIAMPARARSTLARAASLLGEKKSALMLSAMGLKTVRQFWGLTDALRGYRHRLLGEMAAAGIDVLLCPVVATPAWPHGGSKNFAMALSYSMLFNATQLPAGVVPVTRVRADETDRSVTRELAEKHAAKIDAKSAGLPVGVQIAGRPWEEHTVLAVMAAIESDVKGDPEFPRTPVM